MVHIVVSFLQPFHGLLPDVRILIARQQKGEEEDVRDRDKAVDENSTVVDAKTGVDDKTMLDTNIIDKQVCFLR